MKKRRISLLREMIDPNLQKELGLDKITGKLSNQDYFFTKKEVDKEWNFEYFTIYVENMYFQQGFVIIPIEITCDGFLHRMFLVYDSSDNIFYGSQTGEVAIKKIEEMLGDKRFQMLESATSEVVDDLVPEDFWEVRGYSN